MTIPRHVAALSRMVGILGVLSALLACDPAMAIRQSNTGGNRSPLVITVKETHPFIGTKYYTPAISVTNPYDAPILIERVELLIDRRTYSDRRLRPQDWPVSIAPQHTEQFAAWFDLGDSVWNVFYDKSADLRLSVVYNGQPVEVSTTVVGEKLR